MASFCPVCDRKSQDLFRQANGIDYYQCRKCECIFAQRAIIDAWDEGHGVHTFDSSRLPGQVRASWDRSYSSALARVAEAILYTRIPINRFLDIGTGNGFLLDALSTYLPKSRDRFFGVEPFPPSIRSKHENYIGGSLGDVTLAFEAGVCLEVAQHLTPKMLGQLAADLEQKSVMGSFYLFNTGLADYVRRDDAVYLDLFTRGHIMAYSILSLKRLFEPFGFTVRTIRGKAWAFAVEYKSDRPESEDLRDRIWSSCLENKAILHDPEMGGVLYVLGIESARAYG